MEVETFTDIYGKRYTNESLLKGIRNNIEYVNLNTGNFLSDGIFNVGNGVAVLSDIKVFGSTSIGVRSRAGKKISWIVIYIFTFIIYFFIIIIFLSPSIP